MTDHPTSAEGAAQADTVQAESDLVELRAAVLDDFLVVTSDVTDALRSMQQSASWRVSRPLRRVRTIQRKVSQVGVPQAGRLALGVAARRLGR